jgi:hypothetical protein
MRLNREFKVTGEQSIAAINSIIQSNWKPMNESGTPLFVIITSTEEKRRAQQNKYYWAVVIRSIAEQAWVGGKQFSTEAWHELFAQMYGVHKDVTLPHGEVVTKRLSTTEMKVREFSEFTEKVTAYGALELGVRFPAQEHF